jgi:transcriptional regulator with XRE-family HTH domain
MSKFKLGPVLRNARKKQGLTLIQIAAQANLSASYLSQVERNQIAPSVSALKRIADVLRIPAGQMMFEGSGDLADLSPVLVQRGRRKSIAFPGSNIRYEMLTPDLRRQTSILWLYAPAGAESGEAFSHEGEDGVIVIKGTLEVELAGVRHTLLKGDSIYFQSATPHRWRNPGKTQAEAIWISTPPSF